MTIEYTTTTKTPTMPLPSMMSVESVRSFLLRHDGSVTQNQFLDHFHRQLSCATTDTVLRQQHKDVLRLTTTSEIKDGNKYIVLASDTGKNDVNRNITAPNKQNMLTHGVFVRSGNDFISATVPQKLKKWASTRRAKWSLPARPDIKRKLDSSRKSRVDKSQPTKTHENPLSEENITPEKPSDGRGNFCPTSVAEKPDGHRNRPVGYRRQFLMKGSSEADESSNNQRSSSESYPDTLNQEKQNSQMDEISNKSFMEANSFEHGPYIDTAFTSVARSESDSTDSDGVTATDFQPQNTCKCSDSNSSYDFRYDSIERQSRSPDGGRYIRRGCNSRTCNKQDEKRAGRLKREISIFNDVIYYPVLDTNLNTTSLLDELNIDTLRLDFTKKYDISSELGNIDDTIAGSEAVTKDLVDEISEEKHSSKRETSLRDDDSTTDDSGFDAESSDGSILFLSNDLQDLSYHRDHDSSSNHSTPKRYSLLFLRSQGSRDFRDFELDLCENIQSYGDTVGDNAKSRDADSSLVDNWDATFLDVVEIQIDETLLGGGDSFCEKTFRDARKSEVNDSVKVKVVSSIDTGAHTCSGGTRNFEKLTSSCLDSPDNDNIIDSEITDLLGKIVDDVAERIQSRKLPDLTSCKTVPNHTDTEAVQSLLTELLDTIENSELECSSSYNDSDTSSLNETSISDTSSLDETKSLSPSTTSKVSRLEVRPEEKEWMLACTQGKLPELQELLTQHPHLLHKQDFITGYTLLHWAAKLGRLDLVEFALTQGLNVDVRSCGGYTPLHIAAQCGRDHVIEELVYQGADVECRAPLGHKPRDVVRSSCSYDVQAKLGKFVCTGGHNRVIRRNLMKMK